MVVKSPADFVGAALGQSEQQTKGILAASVGKVLVIDEAYGLYGGDGNQSTSDPYKTAVIDTIVAEVQSVPGDDRCVLLLGYQNQMETMFQNVNPGLSRRFPMATAFTFEDFTNDELSNILDLKLKQQAYRVTDQAKAVAVDMLHRARNRPNFGNAGEIDIILATAKARHQTRQSKGKATRDNLLQAQDFDEDFDRADRAETNVRKLFEGTVGCDQIVKLLEGYQETVRTMKTLEMDPKESIPFNFLFRGPPGTGKTTTAKKMGKVFYDMGFLATAEVVDCSATDLVGQYVGQTGPKVQQLLDKALGKVLFVDEAYRLTEGHFAKEAMDEVVDCVTKDRYHKKLIIILAGYEAHINSLMSVNPGLTSRFPEVINFRALVPNECVALLLQLLQNRKSFLKSRRVDLDLSVLETPTTSFKTSILGLFSILTTQDGWANARDVKTLAQEMFNQAIKAKAELSSGFVTLRGEVIVDQLWVMAEERGSRATKIECTPRGMQDVHVPLPLDIEQFAREMQNMSATLETQPLQQDPIVESALVDDEHQGYDLTEYPNGPQDSLDLRHAARRDAGVRDEVWEQLQRDREAEEEREKEHMRLVEASRKESGAARDKIVKRLLEEESRRKREAEMRKKLEIMGVCPAGFNWIKQNEGYRCAGGSHFMSTEQLAKA